MQAGSDSKVLMDELSTLAKEAQTLDQSVKSSFKSVGQMIKNKKLPQKIQRRHDAAVARYESEMQSLLSNLQTLQQASTEIPTQPTAPKAVTSTTANKTTAAPSPLMSDRMRALKAAREQLKNKKHKRSQQSFDPDHLPNSSLKPDPDNKPKTHKDQFIHSGLVDTPNVKLAALGDFSYANLTGADNPAYLAASDEVILSQTIKDKAAELNHDPVTIYHWVRNNIEWLPS